MNLLFSFNIILLIVIIYIYQIRFCFIECDKLDLDNIYFKTGDLILFKAQNNMNDILIGSYYTHVGICFGNLMFEANGIEGMNLKPWHPKNGVFLSDAKTRISKYKGKCYYKPFYGTITQEQEECLRNFILFAKSNFYYDAQIVKTFFNRKFNLGTNCGEIVYLAMVALGILPIRAVDDKPYHCVRYVANLNVYRDIFEICTHPF